MMDWYNNHELQYYKNVCEIQTKYIKREITKEELESQCEIERLKYISWLKNAQSQFTIDMEYQKTVHKILSGIYKE